jgi:hypothetical protein
VVKGHDLQPRLVGLPVSRIGLFGIALLWLSLLWLSRLFFGFARGVGFAGVFRGR